MQSPSWLVPACLLFTALGAAPPAQAVDQISQAENLLFEAGYLTHVKPPMRLQYAFLQRNATGPAQHGHVTLHVLDNGKSASRHVMVDFLSGKQKKDFPDVDQATGNPVVMYFLENDVQEMHDLTGGSKLYFQKRIRMALAYHARVTPVKLTYNGHVISGQQIRIDPYRDDPMKARYVKYAGKYYLFTLSPAVPGGVYQMRSFIPSGATGQRPLKEDVMTLDRAETGA